MKKYLLKAMLGIAALGVFSGFLAVSIVLVFSLSLPKISTLTDYQPPIPSQILASDGTVLAEIALERREVVALEEIPQIVIDSFLSAEDASFFDHSGVDYWGVLRAIFANLRMGKVVQGGSTITQQVAKSLLLTRKRSFSRKIKDILLAKKIEKRFNKQEILFLYLNQVYLGGGYYGVKTAFKGYFGKELSEVSIAEAAMVAGLLVAPGRYSPYINPKQAISRQTYVLNRLKQNKIISEEQYQSALNEKIKFRLRRREFKAGYFTDWIRQQAIKLLSKERLEREGYRIQTTLDWELQKEAEKAVTQGVKKIDKRQGYKGPLGFIPLDQLEQFTGNQRNTIYKDKSNFFTIGENLERVYELSLKEDEFAPMREHQKDFRKIVKSKKWRAGHPDKDPFLSNLQKEKSYQGIVDFIDDEHRLIYVNVLGLKGIIPFEGFRWAKKRHISSDRQDFPSITKPSTILKKGDLILVQVDQLKTNFAKIADSEHLKSLKGMKPKVRRTIRSQKFLKLTLDQQAEVEAALISLNPFNGKVLSWVGGVSFSKSQFNRVVQSHRQPGSSFKPLLFAAALENGFTPSSVIIDSPQTLGGVNASLNWKPHNYDGKFKGPVTVRNILEQSRNIPTIKVARQVGVNTIHNYMQRIGLKAQLDLDLSLALGSFGITLIDLTSSYAIFPNGGKRIKPQAMVSIIDRHGYSIYFDETESFADTPPKETDEISQNETADHQAKTDANDEREQRVNPFLVNLAEDQVYDRRLAYIMTNLLRGVVLHGTGRSAKDLSPYLAGKTGTTNNYIDAWFIGFSSNLLTGVWVGFDENRTLGHGETGGRSALPIWKNLMEKGLKKFGGRDFRQPPGIVNVKIDKKTGKLSMGGESIGFLEAFVEGTEPGTKDQFFPFEKKESADTESEVFEEDEYYSTQ